MINLNPRLKRKILRIIKEEYKKQYYWNDEDFEKDFKDIHSLGDAELSVNKAHLIQIIIELFGADVNAYQNFIDQTFKSEPFIESDDEPFK